MPLKRFSDESGSSLLTFYNCNFLFHFTAILLDNVFLYVKNVMIISATRCTVLYRSFSAALNAVVNPDNVKASVRL